MSIKLVDVILNCDNQYNGHNQIDVEGCAFEIKEILKLCKELEDKLGEKENYLGMVYYQVAPDGGGSIYAGDYFKDHPLNHKDKLLLGINLKIN